MSEVKAEVYSVHIDGSISSIRGSVFVVRPRPCTWYEDVMVISVEDSLVLDAISGHAILVYSVHEDSESVTVTVRYQTTDRKHELAGSVRDAAIHALRFDVRSEWQCRGWKVQFEELDEDDWLVW